MDHQGTVLSELVVKFFHGDFTPQGFKRYSGLWKGPPPGNIGKKDLAVGRKGISNNNGAKMLRKCPKSEIQHDFLHV